MEKLALNKQEVLKSFIQYCDEFYQLMYNVVDSIDEDYKEAMYLGGRCLGICDLKDLAPVAKMFLNEADKFETYREKTNLAVDLHNEKFIPLLKNVDEIFDGDNDEINEILKGEKYNFVKYSKSEMINLIGEKINEVENTKMSVLEHVNKIANIPTESIFSRFFTWLVK